MKKTIKQKKGRAGLEKNLKEMEEAQTRLNKIIDKCKNLRIAIDFQEKQAEGRKAKPQKDIN